jgi:hypothetical protein
MKASIVIDKSEPSEAECRRVAANHARGRILETLRKAEQCAVAGDINECMTAIVVALDWVRFLTKARADA